MSTQEDEKQESIDLGVESEPDEDDDDWDEWCDDDDWEDDDPGDEDASTTGD